MQSKCTCISSYLTNVKLLGDSRARLVYSNRAHGSLMAEHLHKGFFLIGRPECHCAIMMAQVDDGIVGVLAHHIQPASLGADCCHLLSHRDVEKL